MNIIWIKIEYVSLSIPPALKIHSFIIFHLETSCVTYFSLFAYENQENRRNDVEEPHKKLIFSPLDCLNAQ